MKLDQQKRKNKVKRHFHPKKKWCSFFYMPSPYVWDTHPELPIYRNPKTFSEKRCSIFTEDELYYGLSVRGRRSIRNLPCSWDDIHNGAWYGIKSWKRNSKRKRQWKYE